MNILRKPFQPETALNFLRTLAEAGGPETHDYADLSLAIQVLESFSVSFESVRVCLSPILQTQSCLYGLAYNKPRGYAGDFEMIDRIYLKYVHPDPFFGRWDEYCHSQAAPRAVRNRKNYLHKLLDQASSLRPDEKLAVLNIGSGPMRDVFEYLKTNNRVHFDCVDVDEEALSFGQSLCREFKDSITLHKQNILRFKSKRHYDLVWSAGLFDYFSDRTFEAALRRLMRLLKPGGDVVIGNFSANNPTRFWMEAACDWKLVHRSADVLRKLALNCAVPSDRISIESEAEGVNLFLHIASA